MKEKVWAQSRRLDRTLHFCERGETGRDASHICMRHSGLIQYS